MSGQTTYIGRFAPSPTGPLHFGSLVAALASYLDARHNRGRWLVRIEDLDPPRETRSAAQYIIHQLQSFGLHWDDDILYQSSRLPEYEAAIESLVKAGFAYPCTCSRANIPPVYTGHCRLNDFATTRPPWSVRMVTDNSIISVIDRVEGELRWRLDRDVGDFIIKRRDGLIAYQLAVVIDDAYQGITEVVRGNDLVDSTPRQVYLARCLGLAAPGWCHIPVIVDERGKKLSKQNHAPAIDPSEPLPILRRALSALGQPAATGARTPGELLALAATSWDVAAIPRVKHISYTRL